MVGVCHLLNLQEQVTERCSQMKPRAVVALTQLEGKPICFAEPPGLDLASGPAATRGRAQKSLGAALRSENEPQWLKALFFHGSQGCAGGSRFSALPGRPGAGGGTGCDSVFVRMTTSNKE